MISGPHEQPFHCQTEEFELVTGDSLGAPRDEQCSVETRVDYLYRSTDGEYKPLPDGARPADLDTTTTTDGHTVGFIVRVQTGTVNRAIYESAMLHDPAQPAPDPWTRSVGWNGKLVYTHGGGCRGGWYQQGRRTGGVLRDGLLDRGYAVTSASLNVFGQNCNDLLASETHMMVKERFVENYGPPIFTIGTGGSGGSYQSHQTADNYPGVVRRHHRQFQLPRRDLGDHLHAGRRAAPVPLLHDHRVRPVHASAAAGGRRVRCVGQHSEPEPWRCAHRPGLRRGNRRRGAGGRGARVGARGEAVSPDPEPRRDPRDRLRPHGECLRRGRRDRVRRATARQRRHPVRAGGAEHASDHDRAVPRPQRADWRAGRRRQPCAGPACGERARHAHGAPRPAGF